MISRAAIVRLIVILLTLLAFGLQLYRLETKSLWTDEGLSVYRARLPLSENLTNQIVIQDVVTIDTHPPLYFVMLSLWRGLAGESEYALRWLSVFMGTLAIPLLYVTARRLLDSTEAGVWAAAMGALSPFMLWHAQDARMYTLLLVESLLSTYLLLRGLTQRRVISAYAVSVVALMLTHYSGVLLFAMHALLIILMLWRSRRRMAIMLLCAGAIAAIPTGLFVLQRLELGSEFTQQRPFQELLFETWNVFALGPSPDQVRPLEQIGLPALMFVVGIVALIAMRRVRRALLLIAWLFAPLLGFYLISFIKPAFVNPRNVAVGLPALWIGMALGFAVLRGPWRVLQAAALTWLVAWSGISIAQIYFDPVFAKSDVRALANYIEANEVGGDAIVLHDAIIQLTFDYYYHGDAPVQDIPVYGTYVDTKRALRDFDAYAAQAERVWFVWGPEPIGFPERLLRDHANEKMTRVTREQFASNYQFVAVDLYESQSPLVDRIPDRAQRMSSESVKGLGLLAVETPEHTATSDRFVKITTYWQADGPVSQNYIIEVALLDAADHVRGVARDALWRYYTPDNWPQRTPVRWESYVPLAFGSPPGAYRVRISVFESTSGEAIQMIDDQAADTIDASELIITRGVAVDRVPDLTRRLDAVLNDDVRLTGYALASEVLRPGAIFQVDLLWQVLQVPARIDAMSVDLLSPAGVNVWSTDVMLDEVFPVQEWQSGDFIRTPAFMRVPLDGVAGAYAMRMGDVSFGDVYVEEYPLDTNVPEVTHVIEANFGDMIVLHGYDVAGDVRPGQTIAVDLIWQALQKPDRNYTVFLHVRDANDQLKAQGDDDPVRGLRPTRSWRPNEVVRDTHTIDLPDDLPPGTYRMVAGWYDRESPDRLVIVAGAGEVGGTELELGQLTVVK